MFEITRYCCICHNVLAEEDKKVEKNNPKMKWCLLCYNLFVNEGWDELDKKRRVNI